MDLNQYMLEKEKDESLSRLMYKGLPVWLSIRKHVYAKINRGIFTHDMPDSKGLAKLFQSVFYGWTHWFRKYDYWLFTTATTKRNLKGKWVDIFSGELAKSLKNSWILEATRDGHVPKNDLEFTNVSSRTFLLLLEKLRLPFLNDKKAIKDIREVVTGVFKEDLEGVDVAHACRKMYLQYIVMKWVLRLKKNPKAVFITPSYVNIGYVKAFKEKGVKVVEPQHGVISKDHFGYNVFAHYSPEYFPDYILSFGNREAVIFKNPNELARHIKIVPVGSFVIDFYNRNPNYSEWIINNKTGYSKVFGVSLQDCETGELLIPMLIELASVRKDYLLVLKPRRKSKQHYISRYDFPSNIHFLDDADVYGMILSADIHVTAYSSTALEAPSLGKQNILFNINNKARSYYQSILQEGVNTFFVETVSEFIKAAESIGTVSEGQLKESNADVIIPNYSNNIEGFIKDSL